MDTSQPPVRRLLLWAGLVALQAATVGLAVPVGEWLAMRFELLPEALLPKLYVTLAPGDLMQIVWLFSGASAVVFGITTAILGSAVLTSRRGAVVSIYALGAALALGVWGLFLRAEVRIVPEVFFSAGLTAVVFYLVLITLAMAVAHGASGLGATMRAVILGTFAAPVTRPWILSLFFVALSPILAAKAFFENQDFADAATEFVMTLNAGGGEPYELRNAFPGLAFRQPLYVVFPGTWEGGAIVLERPGALTAARLEDDIWVSELIVDFSDTVGPTEIENGAVGLALHPDYATPGAAGEGMAFVYLSDARPEHGGQQINRLLRFDLGLETPEARRASAYQLFELSRGNDGFHNGGSIFFGEDGFLYLSMGEASDPEGRQRIDHSLFGGLLRIDVDMRGGDISAPPLRQPVGGSTQGYFIPKDNPWAGREDVMGEYWAMGLRNPFRAWPHPGGEAIWVGDVGSSEWEEVNVVRKGENHQFPFVEGRIATGEPRPEPLIGEEAGPYHAYFHTAQLRAVIGGPVYPGALLPDMTGTYIYADNYSGQIFSIPADISRDAQKPRPRNVARSVAVAQRGISSLVLDPEGELLITTLGSGSRVDGRVWRVLPRDADKALAGKTELELVAEAETTDAEIDSDSLWGVHCARCHGAEGDGAEDFEDIPMPNFTIPEYNLIRTDEELTIIIAKGGEEFGLDPAMPPWEDVLTEAEIRAMVEHVRAFGKEAE